MALSNAETAEDRREILNGLGFDDAGWNLHRNYAQELESGGV
jgi:hypothetical protein